MFSYNENNEDFKKFKETLTGYTNDDILWHFFLADYKLHSIGYLFDYNIECYGFYNLIARSEETSEKLEKLADEMIKITKTEE